MKYGSDQYPAQLYQWFFSANELPNVPLARFPKWHPETRTYSLPPDSDEWAIRLHWLDAGRLEVTALQRGNPIRVREFAVTREADGEILLSQQTHSSSGRSEGAPVAERLVTTVRLRAGRDRALYVRIHESGASVAVVYVPLAGVHSVTAWERFERLGP